MAIDSPAESDPRDQIFFGVRFTIIPSDHISQQDLLKVNETKQSRTAVTES